MTRKRDIEKLLDDFQDRPDGSTGDPRHGVTASFIAFENDDPPEPPDGWTVRTEELEHATFHVVEREGEEEGDGE